VREAVDAWTGGDDKPQTPALRALPPPHVLQVSSVQPLLSLQSMGLPVQAPSWHWGALGGMRGAVPGRHAGGRHAADGGLWMQTMVQPGNAVSAEMLDAMLASVGPWLDAAGQDRSLVVTRERGRRPKARQRRPAVPGRCRQMCRWRVRGQRGAGHHGR